MVERLDDVASKEESRATRRKAPTLDFYFNQLLSSRWRGERTVRVRPEKIAHGAFVRNLLFSVQQSDHVHAPDYRRQTAMYTKHGATRLFSTPARAAAGARPRRTTAICEASPVSPVPHGLAIRLHHLELTLVRALADSGPSADNKRAQRQIVEYLAAVAPDIGGAVFAHALVVEAVDGGDLARLVVAADQGDSVWVADLEREEEEEGFERVEATVDKVAWSPIESARRAAQHDGRIPIKR